MHYSMALSYRVKNAHDWSYVEIFIYFEPPFWFVIHMYYLLHCQEQCAALVFVLGSVGQAVLQLATVFLHTLFC